MRFLIGSRDDANLSNDALSIDLAGRAIGAGPFRHRPPPDAFFIGVGHLVVLAVIVPRLFSPGLLDHFQRLFVHTPVMTIDCGAVHRSARNVVLLTKHVDPPILIPSGETRIHPSLG